ncbi:hypothetical protein B0H14DRAFT_2571492 [Mycena olivaceomarginata]|nr:hypothetical protein B0H14DRAFT_2571492 [Mycena olivaceomarginata]
MAVELLIWPGKFENGVKNDHGFRWKFKQRTSFERWYMSPPTTDKLLKNVPFAGMVSDPVHIKIEAPQILAAPAPAVGVKAEQQAIPMPRTAGDIKMRALNEGGREVLELLSDSDVESTSETEVMEVLQSTSRSSSAIPTHSYCDNFRGQSNDPEFAEPIEDNRPKRGSVPLRYSYLKMVPPLSVSSVWAGNPGTRRLQEIKARKPSTGLGDNLGVQRAGSIDLIAN